MTTTLSIRQPWAWAIIHAGKAVENRSWATSYRGPLLIHASRTKAQGAGARIEALSRAAVPQDLPTGGVIGAVELVDVVQDSGSAWAEEGQYHWLLENPRELRFTPARGRLGLFELAVSPTAVVLSKELGPTTRREARGISRHFDHPRLRPAKPLEVPKPGESTLTFIGPRRRASSGRGRVAAGDTPRTITVSEWFELEPDPLAVFCGLKLWPEDWDPPRRLVPDEEAEELLPAAPSVARAIPEYRFQYSNDVGLLRESPPFSLHFEHWAPHGGPWHSVSVNPGREVFSPIAEQLAQLTIEEQGGHDLYAPPDDETYARTTAERMARYES